MIVRHVPYDTFVIVCRLFKLEGHYQAGAIYRMVKGKKGDGERLSKGNMRLVTKCLGRMNRLMCLGFVFERRGICRAAAVMVGLGVRFWGFANESLVASFCKVESGYEFCSRVRYFIRYGGKMDWGNRQLGEYFRRRYRRFGVEDCAVKFLIRRGITVNGVSGEESILSDEVFLRKLSSQGLSVVSLGNELHTTDDGWADTMMMVRKIILEELYEGLGMEVGLD